MPVLDSLVVSLRDPRDSGIGSETIFTLVYTSTDFCSIVTAILDFRRSIQKPNCSPGFFHSSVNPSTSINFNQPTIIIYESIRMSAQTTIPKIQLTAEEVAFKAEHDAITSYEEGWDNWDGPQWPIGTVQCSIRMLPSQPRCIHKPLTASQRPTGKTAPFPLHPPLRPTSPSSRTRTSTI